MITDHVINDHCQEFINALEFFFPEMRKESEGQDKNGDMRVFVSFRCFPVRIGRSREIFDCIIYQ